MRIAISIGLNHRNITSQLLANLPAISALLPLTIERFDGAKVIAVTGTNFTVTSQGKVDGVNATTVYNSPTSLSVTIPNTANREAGTRIVSVSDTPGESGGSSVSVTQPAYLQAEYRADAGRTMNGATVSNLADQSGKGDANRDLIQMIAGQQWAYSSSDAGYNGRPVFVLDGARFMGSGVWTSPPTQPLRHYWVGESTGAGAATLFDGLGALAQQQVGVSVIGNVTMFAGNTLTGSSWGGGGATIISADFNGATGKFGRDLLTLVAMGNVGTQNILGLTIGSTWGGLVRMTGKFAHHLTIQSGVATTAQQNDITSYLSTRYGIAVS